MSTGYEEFKKWKSYSVRPYPTRKQTYKDVDDICANCSKPGGSHFTSEGISWCYPRKDRMQFSREQAPELHTTFEYHPTTLTKEKPVNPNEAFRANKARREFRRKHDTFDSYSKEYGAEAVELSSYIPEEIRWSNDALEEHAHGSSDYGDYSYDTPNWRSFSNEKTVDIEVSPGEMTRCVTSDGVEYYVETTGPSEQRRDYYIGATSPLGQGKTESKMTKDEVEKIAKKIYGGKIQEMSHKVAETVVGRFNEGRCFLDEPKNEGGQDDVNEQRPSNNGDKRAVKSNQT